MKKKVCMVVPSFTAKGGITSVVNGYRNSQLTEDYDVRFIETYCDGSVIQKTSKALSAYLKFIYPRSDKAGQRENVHRWADKRVCGCFCEHGLSV